MSNNFEENRIEFQKLLENIMGCNKVYYQPPSNKNIQYPCIIYSRTNIENRYANDCVYSQNHAYTVTVVDKDPDSKYVDLVSKLPYSNFNRHYTSDNLNHDVFTIYFK